MTAWPARARTGRRGRSCPAPRTRQGGLPLLEPAADVLPDVTKASLIFVFSQLPEPAYPSEDQAHDNANHEKYDRSPPGQDPSNQNGEQHSVPERVAACQRPRYRSLLSHSSQTKPPHDNDIVVRYAPQGWQNTSIRPWRPGTTRPVGPLPRAAQVPLDGAGDAVGVAGGEQVQQRATQDGKQQRAFGLTVPGVTAPGGLPFGEQLQPVADRVPAEFRPGPGVAEQGPGVALDPQHEQRAVRRGGKPGPYLPSGGGQVVERPPGGAQFREVAELVLAGTSQQRANQAFLGAEKEQQHARTGPDRLGERAQRRVREPVVQHVPVRGLQQLLLARGPGLAHRARSSWYTCPTRSAPKL